MKGAKKPMKGLRTGISARYATPEKRREARRNRQRSGQWSRSMEEDARRERALEKQRREEAPKRPEFVPGPPLSELRRSRKRREAEAAEELSSMSKRIANAIGAGAKD